MEYRASISKRLPMRDCSDEISVHGITIVTGRDSGLWWHDDYEGEDFQGSIDADL